MARKVCGRMHKTGIGKPHGKGFMHRRILAARNRPCHGDLDCIKGRSSPCLIVETPMPWGSYYTRLDYRHIDRDIYRGPEESLAGAIPWGAGGAGGEGGRFCV